MERRLKPLQARNKQNSFQPSEYNDLREFFTKVAAKTAEQIVLKKLRNTPVAIPPNASGDISGE